MISGTARVGVVLDDLQPSLMVEQPVQHVRRFRCCGRDHLGMEGAKLVGDVSIECNAGLVAVPGVDIADRLSAPASVEELPVRAGGRTVAPHG